LEKGFVQIYTGDGKGKTTAAVGLTLRAIASGYKVFFCQFMKGEESGEIRALKKHSESIDVFLCGISKFCVNKKNPSREQVKAARKGFELAKKAIFSRKYDLVVLDEINMAICYNLINLEDVINILKDKPSSVEIILTGRNAPSELYPYADLISEIKEIKHYYKEGVKARRGIEY